MAAADTPVIQLRDIQKTFQMGDVEVRAVRGVSLSVPQGELLAVMGTSGSGKSTLMNILGCLDAPTAGTYLLDGHDVAGIADDDLADLRNRKIGFVFQSFNLIDELSVRENGELALLYHDMPAAERRTRVDAVMDKVGIAHRARHRPSQLSGGQQQRVAVARAVVGAPAMILADEPTGNLDTAHGEEVMQMLRKLNEEGSTIVMVTHSPTDATYAHRIVDLLDGQMVSHERAAA